MKYINNKLWIDLDSFVDVDWINENYKNFCIAIGKSYISIIPALHGITECLYQPKYPDLGSILRKIDKEENQEILEITRSMSEKELRLFCLYYYDVYPMNYSLTLKGFADKTVLFTEKHLESKTKFMPSAVNFMFFFKWLHTQNIFKSFGRTGIFLSEPKDTEDTLVSNHVHMDFDDGKSRKDQFIWINFNRKKKFFIYNPSTQEKEYITSTVAIFDNANYHGIDNPKFPCFSLRVDGIFTEDFLTRTNLKEHFYK